MNRLFDSLSGLGSNDVSYEIKKENVRLKLLMTLKKTLGNKRARVVAGNVHLFLTFQIFLSK